VSWTAYDDKSKAIMDEAEALDESDLSDATVEGRPESAPDFDPISGPVISGDRWGGMAGGPTPPRPEEVGLLEGARRMPSSVLVSPTPLPPPEPSELAPGEVAVLVGQDILTGATVERRDAYVIFDEDGLRRAFSAIRHARRRLAENERMQRPEVEALERELAILKEANARANVAQLREIAFQENAIEVYAQTHRKEVLGSETPRKGEPKTRDYGIGRISYKGRPRGYRLRQDLKPSDARAMLTKWATEREAAGDVDLRAGPLMVQPTEKEPDLERIKEYADACSEQDKTRVVPDGLEWVPEGETITVKTEEK
jgi:hypothetical protein